ncbi:MAG: hypothetical protein GFH25_541190n164 [Chloroflexi bacterium AL-N10]|nr:hypothetical protein [Chloroflexi bacterium AL-N10]
MRIVINNQMVLGSMCNSHKLADDTISAIKLKSGIIRCHAFSLNDYRNFPLCVK